MPCFEQREFWPYLAIIVPLAALDTLASLMILESVKVAGDDYATKPSLLMNGVGTIAAACLGSPFPTTLYLGHAAHKANGARSAYSVLNGLVTLVLCTTGILPVVLRFVPLEVAAPVIIWFGLITVGQAVTEVPSQSGDRGSHGADSRLVPVGYRHSGYGRAQSRQQPDGSLRLAWAATWRWGD